MRALLSVANREGISGLARDLLALGVEIFATDGTREHLAGDGIEVGSVTDLTASALVGGQVKTFHPAVYAGVRPARRSERLEELEANRIGLIDIVVVNVAPFSPAVGAGSRIDEALEVMDVGGAALLGAAARNAAGVAAVAMPPMPAVAEIRELGLVFVELRERLAAEAFGTVAASYAEVAAYLNQVAATCSRRGSRSSLRRSGTCRTARTRTSTRPSPRRHTGAARWPTPPDPRRGPSLNNLLDLDSAYRIARDFMSPTVAIVKRTDRRARILGRARGGLSQSHGDGPVAAFGGIVGVNRDMDGATAREITAIHYEAVVAPGYARRRSGSCKPKSGLEILAVPPDPTEEIHDYGIATLGFRR